MRIENAAAAVDQTRLTQSKTGVQAETAKPSAPKASVFAQEKQAAERETKKQEIMEESIGEMLKKAEHDLNFQLSFSIHKDTNRVVVKVVDPETLKILREIPPEEMLDLMVKLQDMLGILIDKRV